MPAPLASKGPTHHPMVIIAALAVVLFCLAGTAAILGWIPTSISGNTAAARGDASAPERLGFALAPPMQQALLDDTPVALPLPRAPDRAPVQLTATAPAKPRCVHCGNVESVREITTRAQGSGVGAAGGAILGGLLGNQVGGGNGRQLATVAGAVGGAVVGNQVEGSMKASHSYAIRVRLDDGSRRTFHQQDAPGWRDGDRVRVENGALRSVR